MASDTETHGQVAVGEGNAFATFFHAQRDVGRASHRRAAGLNCRLARVD